MKKTFILLILSVLACSANLFAQTKNAKLSTAKQFFLNLPDDYANGAAKKNGLVFPKSVTKDYLKFMVAGADVPLRMTEGLKQPEGLGDLRVFRAKNRTLIGLRYQIGDGADENPSVDSVKIYSYLLEYKDGKWADVTATEMPKTSLEDAHRVLSENFQMNVKKEDVWIEYQIPDTRNGIAAGIRSRGSDAITVYKFFKWDGAKFVESVE